MFWIGSVVTELDKFFTFVVGVSVTMIKLLQLAQDKH